MVRWVGVFLFVLTVTISARRGAVTALDGELLRPDGRTLTRSPADQILRPRLPPYAALWIGRPGALRV